MPQACSDFLTKTKRGEPPRVLAVFGKEDFLRRQARFEIRAWVVGPEPDDFTYVVHQGADAKLRDVLDDLDTAPMIGDQRLVVVEEAKTFVTANREALLKYVENPAARSVLLIDTTEWPSNTKLAKAVDAAGLAIECSPPKPWHVAGWCVQWCKRRHKKSIEKGAAEWLVELAGTELGVLDQELAKLATAIGDESEIGRDDVARLVAGTRTDNVFKLLELVLEDRLDEALIQLDRQLIAGETPVGIHAMISAQLMKLTIAARKVVAGIPMRTALADAGVPTIPAIIDRAEGQLRRLGRPRMQEMYRRLLKADLDLKGGTELPPRTIIERFFIELAGTNNVAAAHP